MKPVRKLTALLLALIMALSTAGCASMLPPSDTGGSNDSNVVRPDTSPMPVEGIDDSWQPVPDLQFDYERDVPVWDGKTAWVEINGNTPFFTGDDVNRAELEIWEEYSELDTLGRCGVAYANLCPKLLPTEERGDIGSVKPSGWHSVKYPEVIKDKYLYNRCHLIGWQLAGENANEKNLITGTRFMNIDGMLDFEDLLADYIDDGVLIGEERRALYRVTPVFLDDELVARGVLMEGYSVIDRGQDVCFCIFAYNAQPGVEIDYATGESTLIHANTGKAGKTTVRPDFIPHVKYTKGADTHA